MIKKLASIFFFYLYKFKILKRFKPSIDSNFFNSYQEHITVKKIKNKLTMCVSNQNSSLLIKFCKFVKKNNLKIADWGGGFGNNAIYLSTYKKIKKTTIYEKHNLVNLINKNKYLKNYFKNKKIKFKHSSTANNLKKYDLLICFGSLSYVKNIYQFLNSSKMPLNIAISRLPLITNSEDEPVMIDDYGPHSEKLNSKKKLHRFLKNNYKIIYFKKNKQGLISSKTYINKYIIRSYDIFLKNNLVKK
jgi:hypothetical protein